MAYNETKKTTWSRSTPNDGLLFNSEYGRIYANFVAIVNNGGSAPTRDMEALNTELNQVAVVGTIRVGAGALPESGELLCDGSAISRTTYAALFIKISTKWGVGDGANTFNIPDLRGAFLRGVGSHGSSTMSNGFPFFGPELGTFTNDQMQQITGTWRSTNGAGTGGNIASATGAMTAADGGVNGHNGDAAGTFSRQVNFDSANSTARGGARTGVETIPFSASVKFYIKVI